MAKKKKKKTIPLRVRLKRLKIKADKALSEYAREVARREYDNKCPFCHRDPTTPVWSEKKKKWMNNRWVCFHFISRRRKSVRWDETNVIGACSFDNAKERNYPDPYRAFYIRKFGVDKYLALVDKSIEAFEPTAEFLGGIVDEYVNRLKALVSEKTNERDTANPE